MQSDVIVVVVVTVVVVVVLRVFLASISALLGLPLLALTISVGPIGSGSGSGLGSRYACYARGRISDGHEICQFQASFKRDNMFKFSFLYQLKQLQIDDSHSTLLKMLSELLNCTQQMSLRIQDLTSLSLIKYSCTSISLIAWAQQLTLFSRTPICII
jgi:hypothetical protein